MPTKIKLVYPGDEPGRESIIEIWTDGKYAAAGHVLDALSGTYGDPPQDSRQIGRNIPMRIEITPNAPDTPVVRPLADEV